VNEKPVNDPGIVKVRKVVLQSRKGYETTMTAIDTLMKRGANNLSGPELKRLTAMAEAAELYEDTVDPLRLQSSYREISLHPNCINTLYS